MELFDLNLGTLLIVLVLGHILTGLLILSYAKGRGRSKTVSAFLFSKLFQALAWTIFGLRAFTSSMALKITANSVLFVGVTLELIALLMLKNRYTYRIKRVYKGVLIASIAAFVLVTVFDAAESARIAASSLIGAVLIAFPAYALIADKRSSLLQRVIAFFYGAMILFLLLRMYAAMTAGMDMALSSTDIFNTGLFLLAYLVMLAGSAGFILLDKEKLDQELLRAASFDELTDILNRRTFILRAKELFSLFSRRHEQISFLLLDIDDFKKINDEHGHYVGDIVLKEFADTVRKLLRDYDLFARYGGEEFAVLLGGTGRSEAIEVAERLRKAVENSSVNAGYGIKYTVSIGIATVTPDRQTTVDELYILSDHALYSAKTQGKNRVAWLQE